jgi:hypothetical protein
MGELTNALRLELLAIGVTPTALIAALAWWFRARLKQSLAKALNSHTEQVKLEAQREIEAYKVTLIASVERQKAQAELLKAIAIKHATREYEALIELHARLGDVPGSILSSAATYPAAELSDAQRLNCYEEEVQKWDRLKAAADGAHLFIDANSSLVLLDMCAVLRRILHEHLRLGGTVMPAGAFDGHRQTVVMLRELIRNRVSELIKISTPD